MKKILGILVVCLMVGMVFVSGVSFRSSAVSKQKSYTPHEPIYINGNLDFNYENGVTSGSGTEGDPYIIESWDINASTAYGIEIEHTDVYFIIRNCCIHDGMSNCYEGIYFYFVEHGTIESVTSYNNYYGIRLTHYSNNNIVSNCIAYNNYYHGIDLLHSSNNNTITNCICYNNSHQGVNLDSSGNNIITGCTVYNNYDGIYLSHSSNNTITNCNVYNNDRYGIDLYSSSNNSISDCTVYNNSYLETWAHGIKLDSFSNNNIMTNITVYNNSNVGIWLDDSSNNTITRITAYNNLYGIDLYSSNIYNIISDCTVYNNSYYGIYLMESNCNNQIYHNNFIDNGYLNAYDPYGENYWDNGYPSGGNYWSDHTGVDEYSGVDQDVSGSDGIGDAPYNIPASSDQDHYPLMSPVGGVINQRLICIITSPSFDDTVSGTITVQGTASDTDGTVQSVQVSIDDITFSSELLTTGTTSWSAEWDTTTVSNGEHTIYARSYDGTDYSNIDSVTVTVNNVADEGGGTPGFEAIAVVAALVIALIILRRRK